jgi:hypothetical protein
VFYVYGFVFWNNLSSVLWSGPHALSQTHEWRKALISSVRAWLGQALTNEDAAFRPLHFLLPNFFLYLIVQLFFFWMEMVQSTSTRLRLVWVSWRGVLGTHIIPEPLSPTAITFLGRLTRLAMGFGSCSVSCTSYCLTSSFFLLPNFFLYVFSFSAADGHVYLLPSYHRKPRIRPQCTSSARRWANGGSSPFYWADHLCSRPASRWTGCRHFPIVI